MFTRRSSDVGEDGKLLESNILQGRHTAAIDGRTTLKPLMSKRFPPSLINLFAATITSLAMAYLVLRCFERNTLSHGKGTTLRLLSFNPYRSEDECVWIEEPDTDNETDEEVESALPADLELFPTFPGTSAVLYPPEPASAGNVWIGVPLGAWGAEGGYTGGVQGMMEELEQKEAEGSTRRVDRSPVNSDGIVSQHSGTMPATAVPYDPWRDRNIPLDVAEQLKRLLCKLRSFASVCCQFLNHMDHRAMIRFTAALMKVLTMQLGVISLVPSTMEQLRMEAGEALINLGTQAVKLTGNDPTVSRHREIVQDLLLLTKNVMHPRPVGDGLTPRKFKSKILGMLGFSTVVSWYSMGVVMGMYFHLSESRGFLSSAFVERQTHLLNILQAHQLARVVPDCGVRWFIEKCQIKMRKPVFFTRDQSIQSNSLPIPTTANFSSSLEQAIKAAGDLSYKPSFSLKYVDAGSGIGVSKGASPKAGILSPGNRATGKVHIPSTATGVGQEGLRGTIATFPGSSGDASSQTTLVFQGSAGMETLLGSWHSPRTQPQLHSGPAYGQQQQEPIPHLPHLHASSNKPGGPLPHEPQLESQAHHTAHQILPPPVGGGIPFRHFQDKTSKGEPTWVASSAEGSRSMHASSPTHTRVEAEHAPPPGLRIPPSYPWEPLREEQGRSNLLQQVSRAAAPSAHGFQGGPETLLGYHDDRIDPSPRAPHSFLLPVDTSSARHANDSGKHRPATSVALPGAPGTVQAQQVSVGLAEWGHHPLPQGYQRLFRLSSVPGDPYGDISHGRMLTEPPRPPPGLEGHLHAAVTHLTLPPQTGAGSSHLLLQSFSTGPPNAGIQPSVSFFPQYAAGPHYMPPFVSSSQMTSPQRSGTGPQFSLQPPRFPAAALPSTSEQAGISSGLGIAGVISSAGRGRPPFTPSLMEFAGSSYGPPQTAIPPALQHGVEEGMEQMDEIQQAVEAMDPFKDD